MKLLLTVGCLLGAIFSVSAQSSQPVVAIHDSEYTRALLTMTASGGTPTGSGTTGKQWWPTNWNYFVMPESVKEMLRADGTAFKVVGDSNIISGDLLVNGQPRYPIVISLAAEAIRNEEIAQFTNYVAAGGVLFVGSSSFTRNTNGTTRGNFAIANEMGISMVNATLSNWGQNTYFEKDTDHRIINHIPSGGLYWDMPSGAEETSWGISPAHPYQNSHPVWQVQASGATILAYGDTYPLVLVKPYGKGYFIYHGAMQPIIGHGGWASGMYAYGIFREAIEWAFEIGQRPIPKLSPWPFQYDAAFIVRHDYENYQDLIGTLENSAAVEAANGAKGDYYFCTGTLREDMANKAAAIAGLRRAVTNYGATIGPHNGGLKNPRNNSLTHADYDYWHWGIDEALDVTPAGYSSGKAYSFTSLSNAFVDVEGWLTGIPTGPRNWCVPYFNGTRDDSYDIQAALNVKITGEQKIGPFPHWTLAYKQSKYYPLLNIPVNDWYVGNFVAQSMGEHNQTTLHAAVDYYYAFGGLINIYSHASSDFGLPMEYVTYCTDTTRFPRLWSTNSLGIYQWWVQRSNVQLATSYSTNGAVCTATIGVSGSTNANMAVEIVVPGPSYSGLQILVNGAVANINSYRTNGQLIRVRVGTTVTNVVISYIPCVQGPFTSIFSQNFDSVSTPGLPAGWTTSASGSQSAWVTQNTVRDTLPNAAFSAEAGNTGISELVSPTILVPAGQTQLSFRHNYDMEAGWDGGVLEMKIGAGAFADIITAGGTLVSGGFTHTLSSSSANPLGGRQAWSGNSGGFVTSAIELPAAAIGQNVQFRWRCATDNGVSGNGWRVDTVSLSNRTYLCSGGSTTNTAPVLPSQSNKSIAELSPLTVINTATDSDLPGDALFYTLLVALPMAAIDSQGVITWTPSESDGGTVKTFTTRVTDSGSPNLSATNTFTVTVTDVNDAPDLPNQSNLTIAEGALLTVTNTATDTDIPVNSLSYTLLAAPAGASINAQGVISWLTSEADGPSVKTFTTKVTDNGSPALSATNTFTVTVNEVNSAPVLPPQTNRFLASLAQLTVVNTATDTDVPANTLNYSLALAPGGASISPSGVITWTAPPGSSTNVFQTIVTDNGTPPLNAMNTFTVTVVGTPWPVPVVDSVSLVAEGCVPTNNAVDNGETVTLNFALENAGSANTTNLVVTLLQTNGVMVPSGPQNYGVLGAGGAAVNRQFSFTAAGFCGSNVTATLQLQDGAVDLGLATVTVPIGGVGTILTQNFDGVTIPALPTAAGWSAQSGGSGMVNWYTTNAIASSTPNAVFSRAPVNIASNLLTSPVIALPLGNNQLTFRQCYNLEDTFDGGVLEIKIGAGPWQDVEDAGGVFVSGGYTRVIDGSSGSPIGGRSAWSGYTGNGVYVTSLLNLPPVAAGQSIQLRWVCVTDLGSPGVNYGWRIDSIGINGAICCVNAAPILTSQNNRTNAELSLLTVNNAVLDFGLPATGVNYSLTVTNTSNNTAVTNANISAAGVITWTPTEAQGPGTYLFTTIAANSTVSTLAATNTFIVVVTEVNTPPALPVISQQTVAELATLTVTNAATDADAPANTLTYSLQNPPANVSISAAGVITFTSSEAQGPSTVTITTIVSDGTASATNAFNVIVTEVNVAPTLPVISQQTVAELATLTVTNTATDTDLPANTLTYSLQNPPANASINAAGVITFTPSEGQGPSTVTITTIVSDGTASATNSFNVIVTEVNVAPTLPAISQQTVAELATLTVTNTAADIDVPANTLTYSLQNSLANVAINAAGVITFTPSEAQGPSTNTITTIVSDGAASATNTFTVVVTEVNSAPTLPVISQQTVGELNTLTLTNAATDTDVPANTLTYSLQNPPANVAINASGVITFTPSEAQGPSTVTITTIVSDGTASATNSFNVVVTEVNTPPTLPVIGEQAVPELSTLIITNTATDQDIPANPLIYTLVNPPANTVISLQGIITFTPDEAQGPSTNTITTVVSDGTASATNFFTVIVNEVNTPPTLPVIEDRVMNELTTLRVTNTASDPDFVGNLPNSILGSLSYTLVNPPANATIDLQGVITFSPNEAQGPSTNTITTIVSDGTASATNSFKIVVLEVNALPTLPVISDRIVAELSTLTVTNAAIDIDVPANVLTYSLQNPPANASINTAGVITFTPSEAQGPSTNTITTIVSDGNASATNSFAIIVTDVNTPPTLPVINQQIMDELTTLSVTNSASDGDLPVNALIYTLVNPPAHASIDSQGIITFAPDEVQGPSTNTITTVVSDGTASATNSFTVIVNEVNSAPILAPQIVHVVRNFTQLTVTNLATDVDLPVGPLSYMLIDSPSSASINDTGIITWTPNEGHCPKTNVISTVVTDLGGLSATNSFMVIVTEPPQPVIESISVTNGIATVVWSAVPGGVYRLQYKNNLDDVEWLSLPSDSTAEGETMTRTDDIGNIQQRFYRAVLLP